MPAKSKAQQRLMGMAYGNPEMRKQIGISKKDAKKLASTKHKGLPERVTETMNFTEFCQSIDGVEPDFQIEGEVPRCPRGYVWNKKTKRCVPKTKKDDVGNMNSSKDMKPSNGPGYNVWGKTGLNGDGYAYEEPNNWGNGWSGDGAGSVNY